MCGFKKTILNSSLGCRSNPAKTLLRLLGGIIWLVPWPECHSLNKPDFLERTSTWLPGKSRAYHGEAQWKFPTLQESWIKQAWGWLIHESNNHGGSICHHDLNPCCASGTARGPGRRWCYSVPTTALKGKHDFKDPLLYLTWHSSLEGAMAEWKIMVFMTKKHVVDAPSTLSLSLLPISSLKKRFKDLLFYCFDHVPRKENVLYAGTDVAILRWRSWGWKGPSHTEFQSGRAEIVFLTSPFCFDIVSDLHRSGKESLDTPGPVAPNVTAPSHSLYFPFLFFSLNHLRFSCRFNAPFASKYFCVYFLKTRTVSV